MILWFPIGHALDAVAAEVGMGHVGAQVHGLGKGGIIHHAVDLPLSL